MNERGMSLPEVMICAFIFAILVTGLLRYYQLLHSGKQRQYADVSTVRHLHQMMRFTSDPGILRQMMQTHLSPGRNGKVIRKMCHQAVFPLLSGWSLRESAG